MTYDANIPLSADKLRAFPGDVTTNNWPRIQTLLGADHQFNLSAASNDGYHTVIHYENQGGDPATVSGVGQMYTKTVGADQHVYYKTGGGTISQVTGPFTNAANGYTTLPNGFKYQWGLATSSGTALPNVTVPYPSAFATDTYSVVCTILTTADSRFFVTVYDKSTTQFRAVTRDSGGSKTSGLTFYWQAIGI